MGGMGPGAAWGMLRSMRRENELAGQKVGRETALRVLRFARPYRGPITIFLVLVVLSSLIAVLTPVLAGDVINTISPPKGQPPPADPAGTVIRIALLIAGLAIVDAALSLVQRFYSSR